MRHIDHLVASVDIESKTVKAVEEALRIAAQSMREARETAAAQIGRLDANCEDCAKAARGVQ